MARGSRKTKRALFTRLVGWRTTGENRARPRRLVARTSRRPLRTTAGTVGMASTRRWMVGRTRSAAGGRRRPASGGRARGAEQVEQVRAFGVVELQGVSDAVDDALGDPGGVAAFEPDVVLRARLRPAARSPHGAARALGVGRRRRWEAGLLGGDLGAPGAQELADLGRVTASRGLGSVAVMSPLYELDSRAWGSLLSDPHEQGLPRPLARWFSGWCGPPRRQ